VPSSHSRYRPDAAPDYGHHHHAGNVGDVWKHCGLVEILRRAAASASRVAYLESHAGAGGYALGPTGEWSEGIGRLWTTPDLPDGAVARYLELARRLGAGGDRPERYPGSPAFARAVLGSSASLALWEREERAANELRAALAGDPGARVAHGDGLAALADEVVAAERDADAVVVLVDPPYGQKADWIAVPDALARVARATGRACLVLWYPVKSLTRPNAMMARLETAGVSATIAELVTTPLAHQRSRLNGSGVLVVRQPTGALEALAEAAPVLGARLATQAGTWSFRMHAWGTRATPGTA
jgi:23S rRNA (adenine2030-N6)-methyltransferase